MGMNVKKSKQQIKKSYHYPWHLIDVGTFSFFLSLLPPFLLTKKKYFHPSDQFIPALWGKSDSLLT